MISPLAPRTSQPATTVAPAASTAKTDPLANKETFLQLLVAQMKNQDPLNPSDSTQFVTQLAQFSQLEQSTAMRQDLDQINTDLTPVTSSSSADSSTPASGITN